MLETSLQSEPGWKFHIVILEEYQPLTAGFYDFVLPLFWQFASRGGL